MSSPSQQEMLDNVNNAINAIAAGGAVQSYAINGRQLARYSLGELMKLRETLKSEIRAGSGKSRTYVQF